METLPALISLPLPPMNGNGNGNGHAKHGGGPRTPKGKYRARLNAMKHGLDATDDVFVTCLTSAQRATYNKIRRALRKFYEPDTGYEKLLVDRMAIQHLRMLRFYRLESISLDGLPLVSKNPGALLPHLDRLSRYDVRVEKQLRILHNRYISLRDQNAKKRFKPFLPND